MPSRLRREQARRCGPPLNAVRPFERSSRKWIALGITIIALAVTSRVGLIAWPFLNDSGLYAVLGRTVATGGVMYRDFYETKLPGAGLLASTFWRAFGSHWAGYVLCEMAMALLAAAVLARAAGQHVGRFAVWPTLLFAVVYLNFNYAVYTGFQLETIQAFFEALAGAAALEAMAGDDPFAAFAAGLAAGVAAMAKPGGIGVAMALGICICRSPWKFFAMMMGIAVPTLVTAYYMVESGAWPYLPGVLHDINRYASGTPIHADALVKVILAIAVLGFPFALRLHRSLPKITPLFRFALLWFFADFAAVLLQRRLYPYHFLPLACPAALLYGMLPRPKMLAVALGLLPIAGLSLTWEGCSLTQIHRGSQHTAVADFISAHTTPSDSVFADQIGRLLIETDRAPGARLGTFFYFVNDDAAPQQYCRVLLDDFRVRQPKYLVLSSDWDNPIPGLANCNILRQCAQRRENFLTAWSEFRQYVHEHYVRETSIDGNTIERRIGAMVIGD